LFLLAALTLIAVASFLFVRAQLDQVPLSPA